MAVLKSAAILNINSIDHRQGVDFINCFTPYAKHSCLAPNFCPSKKLLKSWAQGRESWAQVHKTIYEIDPSWKDAQWVDINRL